MKKLLLVLLAALVVFSLGGLYVFAGGEKESAESPKEKEEYDIVYVAKLIGIPWFNITEDGMEDAAEKIGNIKAYVVGAPDFLNNLDTMGPGKGYWINVTEDCVWDIPPAP